MRHLKIFGFTALALISVLGFVSAATGQAALYTDSARTTKYATGTTVDLSLKSGSTAKLTNGGETVASCSESTAKGKTGTEAGKTVPIVLESLTWGGCGQTIHADKAGELEVTWTSGGNGEVVGKQTQWTVVISGATCTYGLGEGVKLGTLNGGETPTLKIEALVARTAGGFLCPSAVTWDSEYVATEPHALYVGAAPETALFTDSAKTTRYTTGTGMHLTLSESTSISTTGGMVIATCSGSTVKGKTTTETAEAVSIAVESLGWESCSNIVNTLELGSLEIKWTSGNNGEVVGKGVKWTAILFGSSCVYGFGTGTKLGTLTGGAEPVLEVNATVAKIAGTVACPSSVVYKGKYVVTEPHALYVGGVTPSSLFTDSAKTSPYSISTVLDLGLAGGATTRFTDSGATIATCTGSTAKGPIAGSTGEVNTVTLESLTWSGCSQTTHTLKAGKMEIKWTSGNDGEVIGQESQWTLGVFGTSCSYGVGEGIKLGTLAGGETPTLKIEALVPRTGGNVLCPVVVTWDAEYVVTEPHALYVGT